MAFVLAIDGTAGSGKGTVSKLISEKLNLINVDTGAMYRCVTLKALENKIGLDDIDGLKNMLEETDIQIKREGSVQTIFLDGKDVSAEIRTPLVDQYVAKYAAIGIIREKLVAMQKKMGENENIVMEGRDIGTTVFPNADLKIYLDASFEERARRRFEQNKEKGIESSYEEILQGLIQRHKEETEREISPLKKADDAIYIDSTNITIDEVVDRIVSLVKI